jgi:hypothetical protein
MCNQDNLQQESPKNKQLVEMIKVCLKIHHLPPAISGDRLILIWRGIFLFPHISDDSLSYSSSSTT